MADLTQTLPFSYREIYNDIKQQFDNAGYDIAEGSNTSMLIDSMAYLVSALNVNTALNINEVILHYANRHDNILEDARLIGYEATKPSSYVYEFTVSTPDFPIEDYPDGGAVIIPEFAEFECDGKTYYYTGEQIILRNLHEPQELLLRVVEGTWYRYTDHPEDLIITIDKIIENNEETVRYYVDIPYTNVEDNGIQCFCSYYDDFGIFYDKVPYRKSLTTMFEHDDELNYKFIRLDNIDYKTPRIYFKYAGMGKGLKLGSTVYLNVLVTSGTAGEILHPEDVEDISSTSVNTLTVTKVELVQRGSDGETNQEIKDNAPKYYNSSNRLVTANDYIAASQRDSRVRSAIVWGGEDEFPMSPGHIWFSYLTNNLKRTFTMRDSFYRWERDHQDNFFRYASEEDQTAKIIDYYNSNYISDTEIRSVSYNTDGTLKNPGVWDNISTLNIPTLTYHHRHPIFCQFNYTIEILKYLISDTKESIHQEIFDIVDGMFSGSNSSVHYERFDVEYFNASAIKYIDERVTDISGFNLYLENKLVLNTRTTCVEQIDSELRDIYIPLSVPYESYFENGFLQIDILPNIDTPDFIQYRYELGKDLFVDWSLIQNDIDHGITQEDKKLIIAPVKIRFNDSEEFVSKLARKVKFKFQIWPDDIYQKEPEEMTYYKTKIWYVNDKGEEVIIPPGINSGWYVDPDDRCAIKFSLNYNIDDINKIYIYCEQFCGFYYLFNSYKKEILIHLFVDGSTKGLALYTKGVLGYIHDYYLYTTNEKYLFTNTEHYLVSEEEIKPTDKYIDAIDTTPRSYLYGNDKSYLYTSDSYYLTTNGYALDDPNAITLYSGGVVREINKNMYIRSPLKFDLFYRNRYLNLKYSSDSFHAIKNVMPMLNTVRFRDILS